MLTAQAEIGDDTSQLNGMEGRIMNRLAQLGAVGSAGPVTLVQGASVGALSVPPGWTAAAPEMKLAAVALPTTSPGAAPEAFAGTNLFSEMNPWQAWPGVPSAALSAQVTASTSGPLLVHARRQRPTHQAALRRESPPRYANSLNS